MSVEIFDTYGADPIELCRNWLTEAEQTEPNDPEAVNIATADKNGRPHNRMVLIKSIDKKGFKFHTNAESGKGQDLSENPFASLCFYWKSTRKQIRVEGPVVQIAEEEADEYFSSRSTERQIGAWASQQSRPYASRTDMEAAIEKYTAQFADADNIPRPPYWKGYRVVPEKIEFWIAHKDRLHTRFVYTKNDDGTWSATWLCP